MPKQTHLFPDAPVQKPPHKMRREAAHKVWTENKAQLIASYLRFFVLITKHGAYIDGFAGPKEIDNPDSWAARLVVESEPKFLRQFFWCDNDPAKIKLLEQLRDEQPDTKPRRHIGVHHGDFNAKIDDILAGGQITDNTAAFCLIDQFTCECEWNTLRKLSEHKCDDAKRIELFYFLAVGWLFRSLPSFTKNRDVPERWWGGPDWEKLIDLGPTKLQMAFEKRFRDELGYRNVYSFPIYQHEREGGRHLFTMIHASDHNAAPKLMQRAYSSVMRPLEPEEQLNLKFGNLGS